MKKAPWIGIVTTCCSLLGAAVLAVTIDEPIAIWLFIAWLICSALICAGELIGNAVGKRRGVSAAKNRLWRYGGNIGAGIVCAALLVPMITFICIDLIQPSGGFIDLKGLVTFFALLGIGAPVLVAAAADIISAVIKHKNRSVSSSSPQKRLAWLKFKPFLPPVIGLGVCMALVVAFRLFIRVGWSRYILELTFTASEICLSIIVGMILNRVFGVNFMDNLLIFLPHIRSVYGLLEEIKILNNDAALNRSYIEEQLTASRVYIAIHIAVMLADIVWYIFKLKRDKGVKPKKTPRF